MMGGILENYFEDFYYKGTNFTLHYKFRAGAGKRSIIFLHGLGSDLSSWERLAAQMPEDADIYLVDLLGHGASSGVSKGYSASLQASAIIEFISVGAIASPSLVGHSYGGWIAALIASSWQGLASLVLIDSAGLRERFEEAVKTNTREKIRAMLLRSATASGRNNPDYMELIIGSMDRDLLDADSLSRIRVPTLILWGAEDPLLLPKYGQRFKELIAGSRLRIIDGAGHSPIYTHPNETAGEIASFINSL